MQNYQPVKLHTVLRHSEQWNWTHTAHRDVITLQVLCSINFCPEINFTVSWSVHNDYIHTLESNNYYTAGLNR